jgi:hypothetical protein
VSLCGGLQGLLSLGANISEVHVEDLITMLDNDGSGEINYTEFARWFGRGPPPPPMTQEMRARIDARKSYEDQVRSRLTLPPEPLSIAQADCRYVPQRCMCLPL